MHWWRGLGIPWANCFFPIGEEEKEQQPKGVGPLQPIQSPLAHYHHLESRSPSQQPHRHLRKTPRRVLATAPLPAPGLTRVSVTHQWEAPPTLMYVGRPALPQWRCACAPGRADDLGSRKQGMTGAARAHRGKLSLPLCSEGGFRLARSLPASPDASLVEEVARGVCVCACGGARSPAGQFLRRANSQASALRLHADRCKERSSWPGEAGVLQRLGSGKDFSALVLLFPALAFPFRRAFPCRAGRVG